MKRPKFKGAYEETCSACIENDAVSLTGQPVMFGGVRRSLGCEICGGSGRTAIVENVHGWPKPDRWVSFERKKKPPVVPLEPSPGVVVWR